MDMKETIQNEINTHPVILYMKGNRFMPQCGFSARVVHILNSFGIDYETRDVLQDPELRQSIKDFSNWPTLPQLYIQGQFIGGCDIISQLYESGELKELLTQIVS